ncbi:hypothetical protein ABT297_33590 [Dactylosporangium sp. NPDC000555]|uniref:hypothetical protein n=1 Tax=Dactylosporangium sp. NPDC000555 TaxID=3154260 RepID=UPI00331B2425
MSDMYELVATLTLNAGIVDDELAELRWHLGRGPDPGTYPLTGHTAPEPVFAARGPAWKLAGALVAELAERERGGWALTVRQEVHPDQFATARALLEGVARHCDGVGFAGYLRFYEDDVVAPLLMDRGYIRLPAALLE